jgi:prenyl protein peptidase
LVEEVMFRAVFVSILKPDFSNRELVWITPLFFGIAHIHHFFTSENEYLEALMVTLVQFCYTTLFGFFATFVLLKTDSLMGCIVSHVFCNYWGLPSMQFYNGSFKSKLLMIVHGIGVFGFAIIIYNNPL